MGTVGGRVVRRPAGSRSRCRSSGAELGRNAGEDLRSRSASSPRRSPRANRRLPARADARQRTRERRRAAERSERISPITARMWRTAFDVSRPSLARRPDHSRVLAGSNIKLHSRVHAGRGQRLARRPRRSPGLGRQLRLEEVSDEGPTVLWLSGTWRVARCRLRFVRVLSSRDVERGVIVPPDPVTISPAA